MTQIKAILGYTLAALAIPMVLAAFIGQNFFMNSLVSVTGVKVSPWQNGGAVLTCIDHGAYKTSIHQQVFDGLLGPKKEGIIQIDWTPAAGMPENISEDIDYDGDGQTDLHVDLLTSTKQAQIVPFSPAVVSLEKVYVLKDGLAVRVRLKNQNISP